MGRNETKRRNERKKRQKERINLGIYNKRDRIAHRQEIAAGRIRETCEKIAAGQPMPAGLAQKKAQERWEQKRKESMNLLIADYIRNRHKVLRESGIPEPTDYSGFKPNWAFSYF